jgi:hypothetical protein
MNKHTPEIISFVWSKSEYERVAAQARMILFAPELLQMLQEIVGKGLLNGAMLKDASSIIAKATGEQE